MRRRHFIQSAGWFALAAPVGSFAAKKSKKKGRADPYGHIRMKAGGLATSLEIFSLYQKQAPVRIEMLKQAYAVLEADPQASFADLLSHSPFQALCAEAGLSLLGGPMLGNISETGASVWVRTLRPAQVSVRVGGQTLGPVASSATTDLTAVVAVSGLKPGTENRYQILIDGNPVASIGAQCIRTVPEQHPNSRIAFGSCWHRWGLGHAHLDTIRARKPLAMLMIGDVAVQDRLGHAGLQRHDVLLRDLRPRWQNFASEMPVYVTWDDHDYAANDVSGVMKKFSAEDRQRTLQVFRESWVNPEYGNGSEGLFLHRRIGPADVIMLDNRYFRDHAKGRDSFLGKEQMAWLKEKLLACTAPFIILSCGTMFSDYVSGGKDSWGKYDPEGREELFRFIEEHKIAGVLMISGDRHGARGFTIPRSGGFKFYEFEGACCGGRGGLAATDPAWETQLYGISYKYAFSEFEFNTTVADPTVTFRLLDENETEIYTTKLTRSQLTPG
ncbi:alkaline phosphatase D family protein [Pontiella sulfatireligans]|uniref:Alkaline phosphatase D n=1 Tax=Pontiella sulfatireligans TaxID=2750658 RepID=A0A6C2US91_9BACT|nr:alkaline phosphatase D family protein [Pontiella sulfatireligans]VGO22124.1 Alkaline phosphatase D [Pontiella sulfatireligans]